MIVNINQCASMFDETLHALKYSAIARQVGMLSGVILISYYFTYDLDFTSDRAAEHYSIQKCGRAGTGKYCAAPQPPSRCNYRT